MVQIVTAGGLNVPALQADDFYVAIVNPPSFTVAAPTDVFGCTGTASWGPVNSAVHMGSGQEAVRAWGPITADSLTDTHDLATDLYVAFGQSSALASIEGFAVRVTDGTDAKASISIPGAVTAPEATITAGGTINPGQTIGVTFAKASTQGLPLTISYTIGNSDTLATAIATLAGQINASGVLEGLEVTALSPGGNVIDIVQPAGAGITVTAVPGTGTVTLTQGTAAGATAGATVQAKYTGKRGNDIRVVIGAGSQTGSYTVTVVPPPSMSQTAETFPNLPGATFWTALATALASGLSTVRGPSSWAACTATDAAVGLPVVGTYQLTGGTDGRAGVTPALLVGSNASVPATGLYAMSATSPPVSVAWGAGVLIDSTTTPELIAFGQGAGSLTLASFGTGTDTPTAMSGVQNGGLADTSFWPLKDWIYAFDPINQQRRLLPPMPFVAGRVASLQPQESPGNKPVALVLGTERNDPLGGNVPYTPSEVGQLESVGIGFVCNPIPRGSIFGLRHGQGSSLDPVTKPVEWYRMTSYLARTFASLGGKYVDELQSQRPIDPLRQAVKLEANALLAGLQAADQIDDFQFFCEFTASPNAKYGNGMNTPQSVARHYLFALAQVIYLSSVRFFVMSLQGGTTVVKVQSSLQLQQV